ncbi:MAG: leucine-rich repeat protein [Muribaculaceae bacterium]
MKGKKLLLTLLGGALCSLGAHALNFTIGDFSYATNDDSDSSCTITSVSGYLFGDVELPSTVDAFDNDYQPKTYTVTAIGNEALQYCEDVTSFSIPASVKTIGDYAFNGCISISKIDFPDALTKLGEFAFSGCSDLKSVVFGTGIEEIGDFAFDGISLETIECHATLPPAIGEDTFYWEIWESVVVKVPAAAIDDYKAASNWSNLKNYEALASENVTEIEIDKVIYGNFSAAEPYTCSVIGTADDIAGNVSIPAAIEANGHTYTVKAISANAFLASYISTVTIAEGVETIGENAFKGCADLKIATLPSTLLTVGESAFNGCMTMTKINIPGSVTEIEPYTFKFCHKLSDITLSEGLKNIGNNAFEKCNSLVEIVFPESLESIGDEAFMECKSLASAQIPDNVSTIGNSAFYSCESLAQVKLPAGLTKIDDSTFAYTALVTLDIPATVESIGSEAFTYCLSLNAISIPDAVKTIGQDAFSGCESLTTIALGNGLTEIDDNTFSECAALSEITWGENLQRIGVNAFLYCTSLNEIVLPNSVTTIDRYAFFECESLSSVTFGTATASIGENAFSKSNAITEVVVLATVPPALDVTAFADNVYRNAELIVPESADNAYAAAEGWKKFSQITTGVDAVNKSESAFKVVNNEVTFAADCEALIYDCSGRIFFSGVVRAGESVALPNGTAYIVKTGKAISKIIL